MFGFRLVKLLGVVSAAMLVLYGATVAGTAGGPDAVLRPRVLAIANPRVVVLKSRHLLYLLDGDEVVRSYHVDLGSSSFGPKERQGDRRTPLGSFRVVTKNRRSEYHRFIGIDYPDLPAVERGLARGLISRGEAASLREALAAGRCPDWATALGGGIGIHGGRKGTNWTAGCVAVSDAQIAELFDVLRIGDPVEILP